MAECRDYELAGSGKVDELLGTHAVNMARAGVCKERHNSLVALLREIKEREDNAAQD